MSFDPRDISHVRYGTLHVITQFASGHSVPCRLPLPKAEERLEGHISFPGPLCGLQGCRAPRHARGFCAEHYARWAARAGRYVRPRRLGTPLSRPSKVACTAPVSRPYRVTP